MSTQVNAAAFRISAGEGHGGHGRRREPSHHLVLLGCDVSPDLRIAWLAPRLKVLPQSAACCTKLSCCVICPFIGTRRTHDACTWPFMRWQATSCHDLLCHAPQSAACGTGLSCCVVCHFKGLRRTHDACTWPFMSWQSTPLEDVLHRCTHQIMQKRTATEQWGPCCGRIFDCPQILSASRQPCALCWLRSVRYVPLWTFASFKSSRHVCELRRVRA